MHPGEKIGHYRLESILGNGGMGVVYRAEDLTLGRKVALKFLPDEFASDQTAIERFRREARVLASLNHPHIGAIYGLEDAGDVKALVMELVEGDDLSQCILPGGIPIDNALTIARQIAEALEAAHEQDVIHRDLKPANIKVRRDGTVKVLDFGLAKALDPASEDATLTGIRTQADVIMGTPAYMSPEQTRGEAAGRQTDIWSFGVVLYELLSGVSPFGRPTTADTLASVLGAQPDYSLLRSNTPANVRHLIRRCLEKDRKRRLQHMGDVRIEVEEALTALTTEPPPGLPHASASAGAALMAGDGASQEWRRWGRMAVAATVLTAAAVVGYWSARLTRSAQPPPILRPEMRFEIPTAAVEDAASLAISPDGQAIVFEGTADGKSQLWLHSLADSSARPLPGTESGSFPFWSPDSVSVGFFADGKLKRIDVDTGSVRTLANASIGRGGAWNRDGTIVFSPGTNDALLRVSGLGGDPAPVTRLEPRQAGHRFPEFLPDGRHFLYYVTGSPESRGVVLADLQGITPRRLFDADTAAVFAPSGHLFFARQGALHAQRFDPVTRELAGTAIALPEQVAVDSTVYRVALSASAVGSIAYRATSSAGQRQFTWFDRAGLVIGTAGERMDGILSPSMSPDRRSVAFSRSVNGNQDIWLLDILSGDIKQFTFDPGIDFAPLWSPDNKRVVFSSNRSGVFDLYEKPATGAGAEERLLASSENKFPVDWSSDDRFLLYVSNEPAMSYDLSALPLAKLREPLSVRRTSSEERDGQFSPDGAWVAYQSNESGRPEVYVQAFPGPGGRWRISGEGGGAQVRWRGDGRELFYLALDGSLIATPIRVAPDGRAIEAGPPTMLFRTRLGRGVQTSNRQQYMVSSDGKRFLMNAIVEEAMRSPLNVVLNWRETR
jgi:Tol biopolymer transport system component